MENLPGAVQVLIDWVILLFSTITTFFKKLGEDDSASEETTAA